MPIPKRSRRRAVAGATGMWSFSFLPQCVSPCTNITFNRGNAGVEVLDDPEFNIVARRHSNVSISAHSSNFKTKFEVNEPEPVFEEHVHAAPEEEEEVNLQKTDTSSSGGSVDDERIKFATSD
jgi:hypothetical protein